MERAKREEATSIPPKSLHTFLLVSIPYHQEGTPTAVVSSENCLCRFNPRSHAGNDLRRAVIGNFIIVSIHAPAGGATVGGVRGWERGGYGWGFAKDVFRGLYSMDFKGDFMQWAEGQRARMVGGLCNTPGSQPYDTGPTI